MYKNKITLTETKEERNDIIMKHHAYVICINNG